MNERKQLLLILEAIVICAIFGAMWAIGGSGDFWGGQKWIRRFLAPSIFALWAFFRSGYNWKYFIAMPLTMGASTLPYGADENIIKILLRAMCGFSYGLASGFAQLLDKKFIFIIIHIAICLVANIGLGVWNPLDAMAEQFVIGFLVVLLPSMMVIKKNQ